MARLSTEAIFKAVRKKTQHPVMEKQDGTDVELPAAVAEQLEVLAERENPPSKKELDDILDSMVEDNLGLIQELLQHSDPKVRLDAFRALNDARKRSAKLNAVAVGGPKGTVISWQS